MSLSVALLWLAGLALSLADRPLPSASQLRYMDLEVTMFLHFGICTFRDCDTPRGCNGDSRVAFPASAFNPRLLDTDQWVRTAVSLGARQLCLTAHHAEGFVLWPSRYSTYGVAASPFGRTGRDIAGEFVASCRRHGVSPCFYIAPSLDCAAWTRPPADYLRQQLGMLSELMTRYGPIDRIWMDVYPNPQCSRGACPPGLTPFPWGAVVQHIRALNAAAMVLPGPDGCLCYPAESGVCDLSGSAYGLDGLWAYNDDRCGAASHNRLCGYECNATRPAAGGYAVFAPQEADFSIQSGPGCSWFWSGACERPGHHLNATELWRRYLHSVGRGANWIPNVPPDDRGLIPEPYVAAARAVGDAIRRSFTAALASVDGVEAACAALARHCVIDLADGARHFDATMAMEDVASGQNVARYRVEVLVADRWTALRLLNGRTIGHKSIDYFDAAPARNASRVRLVCAEVVDAAAPVRIRHFGVYKMHPPAAASEGTTAREETGTA